MFIFSYLFIYELMFYIKIMKRIQIKLRKKRQYFAFIVSKIFSLKPLLVDD